VVNFQQFWCHQDATPLLLRRNLYFYLNIRLFAICAICSSQAVRLVAVTGINNGVIGEFSYALWFSSNIFFKFVGILNFSCSNGH